MRNVNHCRGMLADEYRSVECLMSDPRNGSHDMLGLVEELV